MKDMTYYVVELSFRNNNPIHRAICFHRSNGNVELFGSYEGILNKNISYLPYFEVIEEIESMKEKFKNQYKTPEFLEQEALIKEKRNFK